MHLDHLTIIKNSKRQQGGVSHAALSGDQLALISTVLNGALYAYWYTDHSVLILVTADIASGVTVVIH